MPSTRMSFRSSACPAPERRPSPSPGWPGYRTPPDRNPAGRESRTLASRPSEHHLDAARRSLGRRRSPEGVPAAPTTHLAFLRRFARRLPFFLATLGAFFGAALRAVLERDFFAAISRCLPLSGARPKPEPLGYVARRILPRNGACQRKKFSCPADAPERMPFGLCNDCVVRPCSVPVTRPFRHSSILRHPTQKPWHDGHLTRSTELSLTGFEAPPASTKKLRTSSPCSTLARFD